MVEIGYDEDFVLPLGTLGAGVVISQQTKIDASRLNGFRVAMIRMSAMLSGKTTAEGPIAWGIACNMDAAEIEAAIEADPQDRTKSDAKGEGQWLKHLGLIGLGATELGLTGAGALVNKADPIDIKINWSVIEGENFVMWARNMDTSALTTGTLLTAFIETFGVWLRD